MASFRGKHFILIVGVMASCFFMVSCEAEQTKIETLEERVESLKDELADNQQRLGEAHRQVGLLSDQEAKAERLEDQLNQALRKIAEDKGKSKSASEYVLQRDALLQLRDRLERERDNYKQQNKELFIELDALEQRLSQTNQATADLRDQLASSKEITDLLERRFNDLQTDRDLEKLVETVDQQRDQLEAAKQRIDQLEDEHPQFMVSLLGNCKKLTDDDLGSWSIIKLELTSSRFTIGQALRLTLPLSMIDHRGEFKLEFGSLETQATSIAVDVSSNTAAVTFANAAELRAAMQISETDLTTVSFGPDSSRSELVFRIGEQETGITGTTISFEPIEIRLSGLRIVERNFDGEWLLIADE